jgi:hypothetical protein
MEAFWKVALTEVRLLSLWDDDVVVLVVADLQAEGNSD